MAVEAFKVSMALSYCRFLLPKLYATINKSRAYVVHKVDIIQYPSLTPEESERLKMQLENIRALGRSKV
ncbi:hypothetical protein HZQ95_00175 [Elizabethkingia anophelis]|nr:hypothetical protein [Elizabethkingia anophelis]